MNTDIVLLWTSTVADRFYVDCSICSDQIGRYNDVENAKRKAVEHAEKHGKFITICSCNNCDGFFREIFPSYYE